jgi:hypothetical protein
MSETMNLHQVPEAMALHRRLWAGRIMSAIVVIALVPLHRDYDSLGVTG